jgi:hypothetical protein
MAVQIARPLDLSGTWPEIYLAAHIPWLTPVVIPRHVRGFGETHADNKSWDSALGDRGFDGIAE